MPIVVTVRETRVSVGLCYKHHPDYDSRVFHRGCLNPSVTGSLSLSLYYRTVAAASDKYREISGGAGGVV